MTPKMYLNELQTEVTITNSDLPNQHDVTWMLEHITVNQKGQVFVDEEYEMDDILDAVRFLYTERDLYA